MIDDTILSGRVLWSIWALGELLKDRVSFSGAACVFDYEGIIVQAITSR